MMKNRRHTLSRTLCIVASAIVLFTVSCSKDPNVQKRKFVQSGDVFAEKKNYAEAIIQYRNAVALDGNFGEARSKLAATYEATGDMPTWGWVMLTVP